MIKCEECGKDFKTQQGFTGHMRFVHGISTKKQLPLVLPKRFVTYEQMAELDRKIVENFERLNRKIAANTESQSVVNGFLVSLVAGVPEQVKKALSSTH